MQYTTLDSGERKEYDSGMRRDLDENKARFDLVIPAGSKYDDNMLYRWAMLMERGRRKYGERNWELACGKEELSRFRASAFRHFMQWYFDETDEDHAAAVFFNINAAETVKAKLINEITARND